MNTDSKIKVFISSNCGIEKFDKMRKKIKTELEKTQLISVYLFENQATTLPTETSYILKLDDSDVCIFLLEDEPIPDGVKIEIDRAKKTNKKSLYYFCGTKAKNTAILKHSLIESKTCVFNIVNSFNEFLKSANDLVNEIINIYHYYCCGWMISDKETHASQLNFSQPEEYIPKKNLLYSSDLSKSVLSVFLFGEQNPINKTDQFDLCCSKFLEILLNGKSIDEFDLILFLDNIKEKQPAKYFKVTSARWKAIHSFYLGDKEKCLKSLKSALDLAKRESVSEWIIKDILIDIRNLNSMISNERGTYPNCEDIAQRELADSLYALYYPVIDRCDKELYGCLLEHNIKENLKTPYTITFGDNLNGLINNLTNTYMVSMYHGSLTHIRLIYKRLLDCAFYLCKNYSNWSFRIALCKTLVAESRQKDFERMKFVFKEILELINSDDAMAIFNFSFNLPTEYERNCAILTAFTHLGNYLNDADFQTACEYVSKILDKWLNEPNVFIGQYIFNALQKNAQRADSNKILEFAIKSLTAGLNQFLPNIYEMIASLNLNECKQSKINDLEEIMTTYLEGKPNFSVSRIEDVLIELKQKNLCSDKLFNVYKEKFHKRYDETIILNTNIEPNAIYKLIDKYILQIEDRNKTQGVKGYIGFSTNPYKIIQNLIKNLEVLNEDIAIKIVNASLNTVVAKNQIIEDKINAIELVLIILNRANLHKEFLSKFKKIIEDDSSSIFKYGKVFCNTSQVSLSFGITLLKTRLEPNKYYEELAKQSIELNIAKTIDKINCIKLISYYLDGLDFSMVEKEFQFIIKNIILTARLSDVHDIVYYATCAILNILPYEKDIAREQLYNAMNNNNCYIKNLIIQHLSKIKDVDEEIYKTIYEKGLQDSNFFVRENTKKMLNRDK